MSICAILHVCNAQDKLYECQKLATMIQCKANLSIYILWVGCLEELFLRLLVWYGIKHVTQS